MISCLSPLRAVIAAMFLMAGAATALAKLAALPTVLTLVYEWTTGDRPSNLLRALSGLPLGAIVVLMVIAALLQPLSPALAPAVAAAGRRVN